MNHAEPQTAVEWFEYYGADEIDTTFDHVSGWVPAADARSMVAHYDPASIQYYSDDEKEAFVTTL